MGEEERGKTGGASCHNSHNRTHASVHCRLEGWMIELHDRSQVGVGGHISAVVFLIVQQVVLRRRNDAVGLNATHGGRDHNGAKRRILT